MIQRLEQAHGTPPAPGASPAGPGAGSSKGAPASAVSGHGPAPSACRRRACGALLPTTRGCDGGARQCRRRRGGPSRRRASRDRRRLGEDRRRRHAARSRHRAPRSPGGRAAASATSGSTASAWAATSNSGPARSATPMQTPARASMRAWSEPAVMASTVGGRCARSIGSASPTRARSITRRNSAAFVPNRTYTVRGARRARCATCASVVVTYPCSRKRSCAASISSASVRATR